MFSPEAGPSRYGAHPVLAQGGGRVEFTATYDPAALGGRKTYDPDRKTYDPDGGRKSVRVEVAYSGDPG